MGQEQAGACGARARSSETRLPRAGQRRVPSGRRKPFRALADPPVAGGRAAGGVDHVRSVPSGSVTMTRTVALGDEGRQKPPGRTRRTATRKAQVRLPGFMRRSILDSTLPLCARPPLAPCTSTRRAAPGASSHTASARRSLLRRTWARLSGPKESRCRGHPAEACGRAQRAEHTSYQRSGDYGKVRAPARTGSIPTPTVPRAGRPPERRERTWSVLTPAPARLPSSTRNRA